MQKTAPSLPRVMTMAFFALSCFGLLLFLWLSFGGPVPLKAKGYRFDVAIPEATQLAIEAEVRTAGVHIGKVRAKRRENNATVATIEIEPRYAPISQDAKAILRQKTLLGETYVELTLGKKDGPAVPDGGQLANKNVTDAVDIDQLLAAFDPFTRQAFRTWQQSTAQAVRGRGRDLNDSLGNLPGFVDEGGDLLEVLDHQREALGVLVRDTGTTFAALTRREGQLNALVKNTDDVFSAIAEEREAFAEVFRIFPTFLDESKATYKRLETFSEKSAPTLRVLGPAIGKLQPALAGARELSPELRRLYTRLDPLFTQSMRSLPATTEVLKGLRPLLSELAPYLGQLNPILAWIGEHSHTVSDIFANLGVATAAKTATDEPGSAGHYLRQFGPSGAETVAMHRNRLSSNRGNAYFNPLSLVGPQKAKDGTIPAFDCRNAGGEVEAEPHPTGPANAGGRPPCKEQKPYPGEEGRFPHTDPEEYPEKK